MCIIITKEHGAPELPMKVFENAWDNNPDGAGILFNNGKKTTLLKGIMEKEEFLKKVKLANKKENSFVVHTRIATHGSIKPENTHPFVSKTLGFAHNGTMNVKPLPDKTDSESFFLWSIADKSFKWCKDNKFLLDMATDGSRCVVFDMKTGELLHLCVEDWKEDKLYRGCMFSNQSYLSTYYYSKRYIKSTTPESNDGMGTAIYDDENEWEKWLKNTNVLYPKQNIYGITIESLEVDKKGNFRCVEAWALAYIEMYAQKTTEEQYAREMKDAIWRLGTELQDAQMFDGQERFSTQATSIMLSFYKIANHKGYKNAAQINDAFKWFIKEMSADTEEDKKIIYELELLREGWK